MKKYSIMLILFICGAMVCPPASAQEQKLAPAEAAEQYRAELMQKIRAGERPMEKEAFTAWRQDLAAGFMAKTSIEGADDEQLLAYAQLAEAAGEYEKATKLYEQIMKGTGKWARKATSFYLWKMAQNGNVDVTENGIAEYYRQYLADPEFPENLYAAVSTLSKHYADQGMYEKAVDLIVKEIEFLDVQYPYNSWQLLLFDNGVFQQAGKQEMLIDMLRENAARMQARAEELESRQSGDTADENANIINRLSYMARSMTGKANQMTLVGNPAPDIAFDHFMNTEPVTLDDLKGKVVMIDFWANWCQPCKEVFPHMRELYDTYKDQGFVILGVTSVQGNFSDGDIQKQNVPLEEELALTEDLLEKYNISWPIAFSSTTVFNPDYGVSGIPTFAVLDRNGIVRALRVGGGAENEELLEKLIPELLAEGK